MTKKTPVVPTEEVQQIIDHLEDKHGKEFWGAHNFANKMMDKQLQEYLAAYDAKEAERVHHIGRAQEATEEAKRARRKLLYTIQVAKSARSQLKAAKKSIEEKTKEEEELKEHIKVRKEAREAARAAAKAARAAAKPRAKAKPRLRAKASAKRSSSPAAKAAAKAPDTPKAMPSTPTSKAAPGSPSGRTILEMARRKASSSSAPP